MTATRRDNDQDIDLDDLNLGDDDPLLTGDDKLDDAGLDDLDGDVLDDDFEEPAPRPKKRQSLSLMTMVLMLVLVVVGGAFLLLNNQSVSRAITTPMAPPAQPVAGAEVSPVAAISQEMPTATATALPQGDLPAAADPFADLPQPEGSNNNEAPVAVEPKAVAPLPENALPPTAPLDAPASPVAETSTPAPSDVAPSSVVAETAAVAPVAVPTLTPATPSSSGAEAPAPAPAPAPASSVPAEPLSVDPADADLPTAVPTMPADIASPKAVAQDQTPVPAPVPEKDAVEADAKMAVPPDVKTAKNPSDDTKAEDSKQSAIKPVTKPEVKVTTEDKPSDAVALSKPKVETPPVAPVKDELKPEDFYSANETVESLSRMTASEFPSGQGVDGRENSVSVRSADASDPESELAAANRAIDLERYDAALEMFDKLYRQNKSDQRILMGRAVALQKLGRNDEAIKVYDELLAQNPDNPTVMTNMLGLVRKQYPSVALQRLLELRQRYPQNATVAAQAGLAQASIGNLEEGLRYLGIAAGLEPENPKHFFNMGVIAERLGKPELAIDSYEKALQADALSSDPKVAVDRDVIYDRLSVLRQKM